ncbi:heme-binding protein [Saccharothrix sp. S26]|uniref:heme-binding protein n=1 Tax=Saccharothrix sp. S26 TaxID=2907215 RepID=UPI001F457F96|nr:heme-binding protein [Saccharothrix sp. S26]MCE7001106.1 heme-binding protein [Saccharothrix sp. S26]
MPRKAEISELSTFQQHLVGTWTNQNLPGTGKGDPTTPYSYNVMPLPQQSPQNGVSIGYVLKNFTYYETIVFQGEDAVAGPVAAPNRGGTYQQTPFVLFYDQQIRFAEGPGQGQIVHEENGAWLSLTTEKQQIGPYPYPPDNPAYEPGDPQPQPPQRTLAKQISVPHGVSVLALGSAREAGGQPEIPTSPSVLPTPDGLDTLPYPYGLPLTEDGNYQNPQPVLTLDIGLPLRTAIDDLAKAGHPVTDHITCEVEDTNGGAVLNIPFEHGKAALSGYSANYWLLSLDGGTHYDILAYTQRILLDIEIDGTTYTFPHPTCNVLTKTTT